MPHLFFKPDCTLLALDLLPTHNRSDWSSMMEEI
jgi:hypothetical protein